MRILAALLLALGALGAAAQSLSPAERELFKAIEEGREPAAEYLILRGLAGARVRDAEGETPLLRAVGKGMKTLVRTLLRSGASANERTPGGETALHLAALHADPFFVDLLLRAGARVEVSNRA